MDQPASTSRVWLLTGWSSGFGRALATALLSRGQQVIATARQRESLAELATRYPKTSRTLTLDVTDAAQV
ncbi:MAG: SDR family NAD(P)-dependent oxidoreductase, partial [Chthoniobacteraceae bacterium]